MSRKSILFGYQAEQNQHGRVHDIRCRFGRTTCNAFAANEQRPQRLEADAGDARLRQVQEVRLTLCPPFACLKTHSLTQSFASPYRRKIRCTGLQPCRLCIEANTNCTYDAAYTRGRHGAVVPRRSSRASPPSQPSQHSSQHERQTSDSARWHAANQQSPVPSGRHQRLNDEPPEPYPALGDPTQPGTEPLSRASPEPVQTDLEGHYVGPSSGVSFLLRIQKRLDQFVSFPQGSSIFTFGDVPLPYLDSLQNVAPYFDPTLYMMLSRSETTRLVQRYFDFAVPVDRFLHQQTIEMWLEELYETKGKMHNREDASIRKAVLFMVFALAQAHMSQRPTSDDADVRYGYFVHRYRIGILYDC